MGFFVRRYDGKMVELSEGIHLVECPCCGAYHREDWDGDCREDGARFDPPTDPSVVVPYFQERDPRREDNDG